ncbi:hypothetical protein AURDEDRAFT_56616 [Auricularia subglabra TFB-10046 SS5]|nr:hypothetical protein AURDEDRAFT_56616 [Auricularia subglabra TFB-10046 SS5]
MTAPAVAAQQTLRKRTSREALPARSPPPAQQNGHANGVANGSLEKIGEESRAPSPAGAKKIDWEVPRKTLHSSIGFLVIPLYLSHHPVQRVIFGLALALVFVTINDLVRLNSRTFERLYEGAVGFLMRESEKHKVNGVVWYLVGVLYVLILLPLDIAVVAILMLSWADTTASTFGRMFGARTAQLPTHVRLPLLGVRMPLFAPKKSVAGFTAAVITGALITSIFFAVAAPLGVSAPSWAFDVGPLGNWPGLALLTVYGGLVAGFAEALNVGSLDDNLTLPVLSGSALWAFFKVVELLS